MISIIIMSKFASRLLAAILIIVIHGSLLICEEEQCWNKHFALSFGHPAHRLYSWMLMKSPLSLSILQRIAEVLIVVEGVFLLNFLFKLVCSCILLALQVTIVGLAMSFCYQIIQQDVQTTIIKVSGWIERAVIWTHALPA